MTVQKRAQKKRNSFIVKELRCEVVDPQGQQNRNLTYLS